MFPKIFFSVSLVLLVLLELLAGLHDPVPTASAVTTAFGP